MVTPTNGSTCASAIVVCPAIVPLMVGTTAASLSITVVVFVDGAVARAQLASLSVKVVVVLEPGAPVVGVKTSASSSQLMVAADAAARRVDAAAVVVEGGAARRHLHCCSA